MKRLTITCLILIAATYLGAARPKSHARSQANGARPNIIFFITDDQSPFSSTKSKYDAAKAFGFNGEKGVYTPEIDRLARDGIIFTRAYVSSSVCTPSRYAALTGRYAGRWRRTA